MTDTPNIVFKAEASLEHFELVLNENMLLLAKYGQVSIPFDFGKSKWLLVLKFISDDLIPINSGKTSYEKNTMTYTMNKWESDSWIENEKPVAFRAKNSNGDMVNRFMLKIKTIAPLNQNFRQIFVSIWKVI